MPSKQVIRMDQNTFSPTKHQLQKIQKKEAVGSLKDTRTLEEKAAQRSVLYNQPNLFLDDAALFVQGIDNMLKQYQSRPVRYGQDDEERKEVIEGLIEKNIYVKGKMIELMETTRTVLQKIKAQEKNEFSNNAEQEYNVLRDLDQQYTMVNNMVTKEYSGVKRQNMEK